MASPAVSMSDEASKHNTDCVYFLASPLTCKKGNDCEFRHSENARVNPRDCWYWFSGNCLNEHCSFRHPPLDGLPASSTPRAGGNTVGMTATTVNGTASSSSSAPVLSSTSRTKAPCFFYSQGFCGKGMKCMFLHGSPSQFRKEATTYRKPQVSEQHEANGTSGVKPKSQDVKKHKSPITVLHEAYPISSNTYRRPIVATTNSITSSKQSHPIVVGNEIPATSSSNQIHSVVEMSNLSAENRNTLPEVHDERLQTTLPSNKGIGRGQLTRGLDMSRVQILDRSSNNLGRTSEMQENVEELGTQGVRELRAGDLRNRLEKRRRNGNTSSTLSNTLDSIDHSADGLERARLVSRVESKDTGLAISKRVKHDKDEPFTGPKTLAQIKAEKSKSGICVSPKNVNMVNHNKGQEHCDSNYSIVSDCVIEKILPPDSEIHHREQCQSLANVSTNECLTTVISATGQGKTSGMHSKENQPFRAEHLSTKASKGESDSLDQGFGLHSSGHSSNQTSHVQHNDEKIILIRVPEEMKGHDIAVNGLSTCGKPMESEYTSNDEVMTDGAELVDTDYVSDGEDDFAKRLGGFLS